MSPGQLPSSQLYPCQRLPVLLILLYFLPRVFLGNNRHAVISALYLSVLGTSRQIELFLPFLQLKASKYHNCSSPTLSPALDRLSLHTSSWSEPCFVYSQTGLKLSYPPALLPAGLKESFFFFLKICFKFFIYVCIQLYFSMCTCMQVLWSS